MEKHILLIDEDKNELRTFTEAMNDINGIFKCAHAENAQQALEMLRSIRPDIIFIDYYLPVYNGLQLLCVIRNEPRLKNTKVFIYSDTITDEIDKMAQLLGAAGCIEKPDKIATLTHQFKAIFAGDLMPAYSMLRRI